MDNLLFVKAPETFDPVDANLVLVRETFALISAKMFLLYHLNLENKVKGIYVKLVVSDGFDEWVIRIISIFLGMGKDNHGDSNIKDSLISEQFYTFVLGLSLYKITFK